MVSIVFHPDNDEKVSLRGQGQKEKGKKGCFTPISFSKMNPGLLMISL